MIPHPARHRRLSQFTGRLLLILLATALRVVAAEYFVDYAGGSDGNSGTSPALAWQHCPGDPAATGVVAGTNLAPGDTVFFKGGTTYVFTGATGIVLRWNGLPDNPITYDGNAAGTWGNGRAKFTDHHGSGGITAFAATGGASHLTFTHLDIGAIGGAPELPPDTGTPAPPRFGGGIALRGPGTGISIDACSFHHLGYAFNQKPMTANSIAGTAIALIGGRDISVTRSTFAQTAIGIDLSGAASIANLKIADCSFLEGIVWTIIQPKGISLTHVSIHGCTELGQEQFARDGWTGYGESPRVLPEVVNEGATVSFTASAIATPEASFQWRKNGVPIAGANGFLLTLSPVRLTDAGTYTVAATNPAGTTISNEAVLQVIPTSTPGANGDIAPVIAIQPADVSATPLGSATFTALASGTPAPSYQWLRNGVAIPGWNQASLTLQGISTNDVGAYSVVASNSRGSATSNSAILTVRAPGTPPPVTAPPVTVPPVVAPPVTAPPVVSSPVTPRAPVILTQPVALVATPLSAATFFVTASGDAALSYQWTKNAVPVPGWTSPFLRLPGVSANDVATYRVVVTNAAGSVTSAPVTLTLSGSPAGQPPVITQQPADRIAAPLTTVSFRVAATGTPAPAFQWTRNGVAFPGWTGATLTLEGVSSNDDGIYTAIATNAGGTTTSQGATLRVAATGASIAKSDTAGAATDDAAEAASRLMNLSVRANAGSGDGTLIVGFVVSGDAPEPLLVRGIGATLDEFGVPRTLPDPALALYAGSSLVAANDDWHSAPEAGAIPRVASKVGAFALRDASTDAALLADVSAGVYTAQVQGKQGAEGTALIELYETDPQATSRLVNVSTRVTVDGITPPIIGFVVQGSGTRRLLIRAVGRSLTAFGLENSLPDPRIELFRDGASVARNDNWGGTDELVGAFARTGAFALSGPDSTDAALIFTAAPGAYTIVVSGATDARGIVLVELYELP